MATKVKADDFAKAVAEILTDYHDMTVEVIEESAVDAAEDAVAYLKTHSPKRKGKYAKSWKHEEAKNKKGHVEVIKNTQYQLTHLLEYGHAKRNGDRVKGTPHIKPAEDLAIKKFQDNLKKGIENGG